MKPILFYLLLFLLSLQGLLAQNNQNIQQTEIPANDWAPKKFFIQAHSGYASLTASSTQAMYSLIAQGFDHASASQYYKQLRHTFINDLSFHYLLFTYNRYRLSMGLMYQNMYNQSEVSSSSIQAGDGIHLLNGSFGEKIYTNHYSYCIRHDLILGKKQQSSLFLEGGTGLLSYRNQLELVQTRVLIQGIAPAYFSQFGYAQQLSSAWSVEIAGGIFASALKNLKLSTAYSSQYSELSSDQYESLNRVFVKIGLTRHF